MISCTLDCRFFKRDRSKRDVNPNFTAAHKKHSTAESKLGRVLASRFIMFQDLFNVGTFFEKTCEESDVNVSGDPRLTPSLQSNAANNAETPIPRRHKVLDILG